MWLERISLENFRNYEKLEIEFAENDKVHLIIGDNAQGKTNFLEAVFLLSMSKSFRTAHYDDMILWTADYMRTTGNVNVNGNDLSLEFFVSKAPIEKKNLRKNGVDVPVKDFIGRLNSVLFHPEDLNMLYLTPSLRRKYINSVLSQTDPIYFDALVNYNRILKQRNKILMFVSEGHAKMDELLVWDEKMAEYAFYIYEKRREFVSFYNGIISERYQNIAEENGKIEIKNSCSFGTVPEGKKEYEKALSDCRQGDLRYQQTQKGPHRDDLEFFFDGRNVETFASRGEMRTLLIAVKLAEIEFLEAQTGHRPILLLDDVFSELDKKRQQALLTAISEYQSFVTTTHHDFLIKDARVIEIGGGSIVSQKIKNVL
jgi:DNA replication and repair protein RecF